MSTNVTILDRFSLFGKVFIILTIHQTRDARLNMADLALVCDRNRNFVL